MAWGLAFQPFAWLYDGAWMQPLMCCAPPVGGRGLLFTTDIDRLKAQGYVAAGVTIMSWSSGSICCRRIASSLFEVTARAIVCARPRKVCRNARLTLWCIAVLFAVDAIWLCRSSLRFAPENWALLALLAAPGAVIVVLQRLIHGGLFGSRMWPLLHRSLRKATLVWRGGVVLALVMSLFLVSTYLATAAALPLRDDVLVRIDHGLGFDWPSFLAVTNSHPRVAELLSLCYHSTGFLLVGIVVWLPLTGRAIRLVELHAVLSLTLLGLTVAMVLVPTAGAFAYYRPAADAFGNFAPADRMWSFYATYVALREGTLATIQLSQASGIVSFPSFHAALGVVTIHALRDTRWLVTPVLAVNVVMVAAVLPVGGHHLAELLAGLSISVAAIAMVRCWSGVVRRRRVGPLKTKTL